MKSLSRRTSVVQGLTVILGLAIAVPASAAIEQIIDQSWVKVAQASGDEYMHFPRAIAFDVVRGGSIGKKILVNWQSNPDVIQFPMTHGWMGSLDDGITWDTPAPTTTPEIDCMLSIRRITDGAIIAIPYYPNPNLSGVTSFTFSYHISTNNGVSWTPQTNAGVVNSGSTDRFNSLRLHRGIVQDSDGTLYAPAYGSFVGVSSQSMVLKSTNGGQAWTFLRTIAIGYNETSLVRCKDGSLLAIMRSASSATLGQARSTNNGVSWTPAVAAPGLPANSGVDPYLWLMPDGVLVLSYGNNVPGNMRHCLLAFSDDGNGTTWSNVIQTFTSSTSGLGNKSSGYTSVVPLTAHRFLQVSDRALYNYYGSTLHPTPNPFSIWTKTVDIVLSQPNRIDLKAGAAAGTITVTTDLTSSTHHVSRSAPDRGIRWQHRLLERRFQDGHQRHLHDRSAANPESQRRRNLPAVQHSAVRHGGAFPRQHELDDDKNLCQRHAPRPRLHLLPRPLRAICAGDSKRQRPTREPERDRTVRGQPQCHHHPTAVADRISRFSTDSHRRGERHGPVQLPMVQGWRGHRRRDRGQLQRHGGHRGHGRQLHRDRQQSGRHSHEFAGHDRHRHA